MLLKIKPERVNPDFQLRVKIVPFRPFFLQGSNYNAEQNIIKAMT